MALKTKLTGGAVLVGFAALTTMSALAADVSAPTDPWTGLYLGAQAGFLQSTSDSNECIKVPGEGNFCDSGVEEEFYGVLGFDDASGITAGGYLGYNFRVNSVLLGVEGDLNWDNAQEDSMFVSNSLEWDASVRARFGFIVNDRAMLYVTGGPSWLAQSIDVSVPCGSCGLGEDLTRLGWQLGGGAEYFVSEHLSVKAEYLHGWYGDEDLDIARVCSCGANLHVEQELETNVFRAGVAYHFGSL